MNDAFRMLFDQLTSGVVWLQRDGSVRYANKAAVQMTPVLLKQPMLDPVAARTVQSGAQGLLSLPFEFTLTTQEAHADTIRAVLIPAPVGNDLMVVLNNVSRESWYSQALDNLMGYLHAELAQPMNALGSRLSQVVSLAEGPQALADLEAIAQQAHNVASRLGQLKDLVTVFGDSPMQQSERILLPDLLRSAVQAIMPVASRRHVQILLRDLDAELPPVYGSPHWLGQAVSELITHCVMGTPPGGVIGLSVQTLGARVMLRALNQGRFVSQHERRSAFVPFGVGDDPHGAERRSIGLALSRRVLALHGGSVRISDEADGVAFVMDLPAGAPVEQGEQQAIAQAQRYAKDMAQLMSRRAKPSALTGSTS